MGGELRQAWDQPTDDCHSQSKSTCPTMSTGSHTPLSGTAGSCRHCSMATGEAWGRKGPLGLSLLDSSLSGCLEPKWLEPK
eukprot:9644931-Heterocapsa_arctica.AAC.1